MLAAVLVVPLAYLWATVVSAGAVWFVAGLCAQHASESAEPGTATGRKAPPATWWERLREGAWSGCAYFSAWCGVYLAAVIIAVPTAVQFTDQRSSIGLRQHSHLKVALIAGCVLVLVHLVRLRREALRRARSGVFGFAVPLENAWKGFRFAAGQAGCRRPTVEIRWPPGSIEQRELAATIAMCHVLQEDGPQAGSIGQTVAAVTAWSLVSSAGAAQQPRVLDFMIVEFFALFVVSASRVLSPGRLLTRIPRSSRTPIHILACLSTEPASLGSDPLASHRGPLETIVRDLRALARNSEGRTRYREAVDPHPLVLRGTARNLARYLANRESTTGQKPKPLMFLLRRNVAFIEGGADRDALERAARAVGAYKDDGTADPELIVRPQRLVARWGTAVATRIARVRETTSALAAILLLLSALVMLLDRHLALDSLPSFVK